MCKKLFAVVTLFWCLYTEAAIGGVLLKMVFLEILQNWQENTCARVSFLIKLQALALNFIKKETLAQVFSCQFSQISKNIFSISEQTSQLILATILFFSLFYLNI